MKFRIFYEKFPRTIEKIFCYKLIGFRGKLGIFYYGPGGNR